MSHEKCHFFETATLAFLERFLTRFCTTETGINTSYIEDTEFKLQHNCVSAFLRINKTLGVLTFWTLGISPLLVFVVRGYRL